MLTSVLNLTPQFMRALAVYACIIRRRFFRGEAMKLTLSIFVKVLSFQ
jgi:hypothetical protein